MYFWLRGTKIHYQISCNEIQNSRQSQPLLMVLAKHAGLADPRCQLYMMFYYLGPASVAFTLRRRHRRRKCCTLSSGSGKQKEEQSSQSIHLLTQQFHLDELSANMSSTKCRSQKHVDGASHDVSHYGTISKSIFPADDVIEEGDNSSPGSHGKNYATNRDLNAKNHYNYDCNYGDDEACEYTIEEKEWLWPPRSLLIKAAAIAVFDIFAQSMTYTGELQYVYP